MTYSQISTITMLRKTGAGYSEIATILGLSNDSVKKYCQRHKIAKGTIVNSERFCPVCGTVLIRIQGKKNKHFCCDSCRYKWWNLHRSKEGHK